MATTIEDIDERAVLGEVRKEQLDRLLELLRANRLTRDEVIEKADLVGSLKIPDNVVVLLKGFARQCAFLKPIAAELDARTDKHSVAVRKRRDGMTELERRRAVQLQEYRVARAKLERAEIQASEPVRSAQEAVRRIKRIGELFSRITDQRSAVEIQSLAEAIAREGAARLTDDWMGERSK